MEETIRGSSSYDIDEPSEESRSAMAPPLVVLVEKRWVTRSMVGSCGRTIGALMEV